MAIRNTPQVLSLPDVRQIRRAAGLSTRDPFPKEQFSNRQLPNTQLPERHNAANRPDPAGHADVTGYDENEFRSETPGSQREDLNLLLADIAGQVYVAFGQGTGRTPVSNEVIRAVRDYFLPRAHSEVYLQWQEWRDQALSRVRAIGRLAAKRSRDKGRQQVEAEDFLGAAQSFLPEEA